MAADLLAPARRAPAGDSLGVPAALAAAAVALQIVYPLVHGTVRNALTVAVVVLFAASSAVHAVGTRGRRGAVVVATTTVTGFAVELLGVHTGFPFGDYHYTDALGLRLGGVPLVVAAAWTMLAWPAALVARHLVHGRAARVLVGAWALASWDLFLDPQMVVDGRWRWSSVGAHLPGIPDVPLSNFVGWLGVSLVLSAIVQALLGDDRRDADDRVPFALYLWTWLGSTVAFVFFLDLRQAVVWGAVGMGLVGVPLVLRLRR
ncbi:MAG: carotenoid biosynthesis protein [Jatrophihabitans sp.]|uniref:carotenoid biosynthesis protein n=1 Tax=Jatrophihabitans sp. TaxID=1932789 RepID=UPI003F7F5F4F